MNAGLTNLSTLKLHLLGKELADDTRWDEIISTIGLGVCGMMEQYCNRKFGYLAGATMEVSGNREHVTLPRYPVVSVSKVETKWGEAGGWTQDTGQPYLVVTANGIVNFNVTMGDSSSLVRVTWTGGYWWETLEPDDPSYPSTIPTAATALPAELQAAFVLQCRRVWESIDKTGTKVLETGIAGGLAETKLIPMVSGALGQYIRYQLS